MDAQPALDHGLRIRVNFVLDVASDHAMYQYTFIGVRQVILTRDMRQRRGGSTSLYDGRDESTGGFGSVEAGGDGSCGSVLVGVGWVC